MSISMENAIVKKIIKDLRCGQQLDREELLDAFIYNWNLYELEGIDFDTQTEKRMKRLKINF